MKLVLRLLVASAVLSLAGSAATCAWAALRLAIAVEQGSAPRPPADRPALVILRGDLGYRPEATHLGGRGGPRAAARPLPIGCRYSSSRPGGR